MKNQYSEGDCLKRGAWTVCQFKGGLGKKEGVMFLRGGGVDTPMRTMNNNNIKTNMKVTSW